MITFLSPPFWSAMDAIDSAEDYEDEDNARFEAAIAADIRLKLQVNLPVDLISPAPGPSMPRCASPTSYYDGPTVSTPGDPAGLPPPDTRPRTSLSTYAPNIPSPINSPRRSSTYEGSAKRDDPATPASLGVRLVKNRSFRTMTSHFKKFETGLAAMPVTKKAPILDGCRICLPVDADPPKLHEAKWKSITSLGAKVVIQPDTAITHVIHGGPSAMALAGKLGLESLSELPEGTICVKWDWIVNCRRASCRLEPDNYLCFRSSLKARTTSKLREEIGGVKRRRENTASESETESSSKPPRPQRHSSPAKLPAEDNRTVHEAAKGPGWVDDVERDGLDEVISGVQTGALDEDGNPNALGDRFKCGQSNDGTDKGPNAWLASKVQEMHDMYAGSKHKTEFQIRGYLKAAAAIARTNWAIKSGAEAIKITGIGEGLKDRIDEFLNGRQGRMFYDLNEEMQVSQVFTKVYGIGKTQAAELYQKGARSLADLADPAYHLSENQKVGLELYDDLNTRIPRAECKTICELVRAEALTIDPQVWIEIMGSYRRGQETSGDVDFLITRDPKDGRTHAHVLRQLVRALTAKGFITHELSQPGDWLELEAKWMGICKLENGLYRRIDILCIPFESWGAALIYFTGNDIFNRSLRLYARKLGYSLNQRGLSAGVSRARDGVKQTEGVIVASRTEQDIFGILGLKWRPPHERRP